MDFKDLSMAQKVFTKLKHECQAKLEFTHKMITYKQLGYIYRLQYRYLKATNCFKKFLQLAWYSKDRNAELEAYENLRIDYFYLGEMKKAKFYDEKFSQGLFEREDESIVRKRAVQIIENQVKDINAGRKKMRPINGKLVKSAFDRMPSPSSFGGSIKLR